MTTPTAAGYTPWRMPGAPARRKPRPAKGHTPAFTVKAAAKAAATTRKGK